MLSSSVRFFSEGANNLSKKKKLEEINIFFSHHLLTFLHTLVLSRSRIQNCLHIYFFFVPFWFVSRNIDYLTWVLSQSLFFPIEFVRSFVYFGQCVILSIVFPFHFGIRWNYAHSFCMNCTCHWNRFQYVDRWNSIPAQ